MVRLPIPLDPSRTGGEAARLHEALTRSIIGQRDAIDQIVNMYQLHLAGLNAPGRPVANFLFLGPTGSGKTRTVEATAEILLGVSGGVIKIDCGEYQHGHEIAKLVGSPPGYLGHRETHPLLSQENLDRHHTDSVKLSFVLFDEIEKASDTLWNLLLGILDKATLTLGDNRRVDFSRAMVFMTSNLGAAEIDALLSPRLGFRVAAGPSRDERAQTDHKIAGAAVEAARRKFTPEFMNRLDKIVVFKPLGTAELRQILDIELRMVQNRIFRSTAAKPFIFTVTEPAKAHVLERGTDLKYGARPLKRAIESLIVQPIANLAATDQVRRGDWLSIDFDPSQERMVFLKQREGMSVNAMAEAAGLPLSMSAAA